MKLHFSRTETVFCDDGSTASQLTCQVKCRKLLVFGSRKAFPLRPIAFPTFPRDWPQHPPTRVPRANFVLNQLNRRVESDRSRAICGTYPAYPANLGAIRSDSNEMSRKQMKCETGRKDSDPVPFAWKRQEAIKST